MTTKDFVAGSAADQFVLPASVNAGRSILGDILLDPIEWHVNMVGDKALLRVVGRTSEAIKQSLHAYWTYTRILESRRNEQRRTTQRRSAECSRLTD